MIFVNKKLWDYSVFPDGAPLLSTDALLTPTNGNSVEICWLYDSMEEFFPVLSLIFAAHEQALTAALYLPYLPNARMDRQQGTSIFTLRHFCDLLNYAAPDRVTLLDCHSHVGPALLRRCLDLPPISQITEAQHCIRQLTADTDPFLVYPDAGAAKRYSGLPGMPPESVIGCKRRDWETGRITRLELIGDIPHGRPALIVDDICSRGGTFLLTAQALRAAGVSKVYLYVTHCENTIFSGDLLTSGLIDRVYTTNSIYRGDHPMIHAAPLL